jgi:hypothetical protein
VGGWVGAWVGEKQELKIPRKKEKKVTIKPRKGNAKTTKK